MKKTILLAGLLAVGAQMASAQKYNFTMSTANYTELTAPTVVSTPGWQDDQFTVPVGFPVIFYGQVITDVEVTDGSLYFNEGYLDAFFADMEDNGTSIISYQLEGTTPNRILKIQWKNVGFAMGQPADFANLQAWIYEGTNNKVEMHYGPSNTSSADFASPATGPDVGLSNDDESKSTCLSGNPAAPTVNYDLPNYVHLSGVPVAGTVYTFVFATTAGIAAVPASIVNAGPNPFSTQLSLEIKNPDIMTSVKLYDLQGKVVIDENIISQSSYTMNTETIPAGVYMLIVSNGKEMLSRKLLKN